VTLVLIAVVLAAFVLFSLGLGIYRLLLEDR
jgi:hypothetical protein